MKIKYFIVQDHELNKEHPVCSKKCMEALILK